MLTLTKYLNIAERMLNKYTNGGARSEDAISYVAHYLMLADSRFDGRGSRGGYRGSYGRFAVLKWLKSKSKKGPLSLDYELSHDENNLYDELKSNDMLPEEECLLNDILDDVDLLLTPKQKRCLMGHIDGETYVSIGQTFTPPITKERVRQIINDSIEILKNKYAPS